jgi:hypothetical protein
MSIHMPFVGKMMKRHDAGRSSSGGIQERSTPGFSKFSAAVAVFHLPVQYFFSALRRVATLPPAGLSGVCWLQTRSAVCERVRILDGDYWSLWCVVQVKRYYG